MVVWQGAAYVEQRPTPEAVEIEGRSRRLAECPPCQSIVDATAAVEMAKEGDCIT
jgi:hypothetical protein